MEDYLKRLQQENEQLKNDNALLLSELKACRDDLSEEAEALTVIKKEMRRCDVQLNSLKTENEELKNKFAKIENNPIGRFLLKLYRWLRELKRRRGS